MTVIDMNNDVAWQRAIAEGRVLAATVAGVTKEYRFASYTARDDFIERMDRLGVPCWKVQPERAKA